MPMGQGEVLRRGGSVECGVIDLQKIFFDKLSHSVEILNLQMKEKVAVNFFYFS